MREHIFAAWAHARTFLLHATLDKSPPLPGVELVSLWAHPERARAQSRGGALALVHREGRGGGVGLDRWQRGGGVGAGKNRQKGHQKRNFLLAPVPGATDSVAGEVSGAPQAKIFWKLKRKSAQIS